MQSVTIQCTCGALKGSMKIRQGINHCVCYCADCQAFANHLKRADEILDQRGGTEVIQTSQANITLLEGIDNLACLRLTPKGIIRWYTSCCNTPIGNTLPNHKLAFIGLVHNCLYTRPASLEQTFGPVSMVVNTAHARGEPRPEPAGLLRATARIIFMMLKDRLTGRYRESPFFNAQTGKAIVKPVVIDKG